MADDSDLRSPADAGRPKRPPPTIELTPEAVSERPAAGETAAAAETVTSETPAEAIDTAPSDMPPFDASEPVAEEPAKPERSRRPLLVSTAAGAVAGAIVAAGAWAVLDGFGSADRTDLDALNARIAQLEARPAAAPDSGLSMRVDTLEKSIAGLRNELAATKTQSERIATDVNQLKSAPPSSTAAVDLGPINARLDRIERAAGELKSAAVQQSAKPADDTALRRMVAASQLDASVRQSEPYAAALAAVRPLVPDARALKPLDAFAVTGLPSAASLSRELLALLPKLSPSATAAPSGGWLDRLQAGAVRMLHIERTDAGAISGNDAIARAAAAARSNDVATAKRELLMLPAADRAAAQPWLDKVDARDAALASSRQFAADAMAALSKPAP